MSVLGTEGGVMTRKRALDKAPRTVVATAALVGLRGGQVAVQLDVRDDEPDQPSGEKPVEPTKRDGVAGDD
jgi:hypothetical protein